MEISYFFSLISEDGFKFGTLEKILNVGKSTLKNDMKEVREELHKQGFSFISRPKKGLILVGNENNIRKLLLEYILKYFCIKNFDSIEIRKAAEPVSKETGMPTLAISRRPENILLKLSENPARIFQRGRL